MNVNEETLMRERVPLEMQGRVFSAKSTLQNFTIPPALLLGGLLADTIFEPFMMTDSPAQQANPRRVQCAPCGGFALENMK